MSQKPRLVRGLSISYPVFLEESYKKCLLRLVKKLRDNTFQHVIHDSDFHDALTKVNRHDDIIDDFSAISKSLNTAISIEISRIVQALTGKFDTVKRFTESSFKRSFEHISARLSGRSLHLINVPDVKLDIKLLRKMWVEKNTSLIKDIPTQALSKVRDAVYESVQKGESMQSLAKRLETIFDVTEKRAKNIARDQISKLRSDISRYNDLSHGITQYEWSSCKDGAVRASHRAMEGKICSWLDSTTYKNKANDKWKKRKSIGGIEKHAGEDIMCRCTNVALVEVS